MSIIDRIKELNFAREHLPEFEYNCRKESILRTLQTSLPGNRSVHLVIKEGDHITDEPAKMADALRQHWAKVFAGKKCLGAKILDAWMHKHPYGLKRQTRLS